MTSRDSDKYLIELLNRMTADITRLNNDIAEMRNTIKEVVKEQNKQSEKITVLKIFKERVEDFLDKFKSVEDQLDDLENASNTSFTKLKKLARRNSLILKAILINIIFTLMLAQYTHTLVIIFEKLKEFLSIIF